MVYSQNKEDATAGLGEKPTINLPPTVAIAFVALTASEPADTPKLFIDDVAKTTGAAH